MSNNKIISEMWNQIGKSGRASVVKRYKEDLLNDETTGSIGEMALAMSLREGVIDDDDLLYMIEKGFI